MTRYSATVTSFGWAPKVLLGCPPWLALACWAYMGVFNHPLYALVFAVPLTWAAVWWTRHVWTRHQQHPQHSAGPDPTLLTDPPPGQPHRSLAPTDQRIQPPIRW